MIFQLQGEDPKIFCEQGWGDPDEQMLMGYREMKRANLNIEAEMDYLHDNGDPVRITVAQKNGELTRLDVEFLNGPE